jgi:hypothetical protein
VQELLHNPDCPAVLQLTEAGLGPIAQEHHACIPLLHQGSQGEGGLSLSRSGVGAGFATVEQLTKGHCKPLESSLHSSGQEHTVYTHVLLKLSPHRPPQPPGQADQLQACASNTAGQH